MATRWHSRPCLQKLSHSGGDSLGQLFLISLLLKLPDLFGVSQKPTLHQDRRAGGAHYDHKLARFDPTILCAGGRDCVTLNPSGKRFARRIRCSSGCKRCRPAHQTSAGKVGLKATNGGVWIGIQMDADKGGCLHMPGNLAALFEFQKAVLLPGHPDVQAQAFQVPSQLVGQFQAKLFFNDSIGDRSAIMAAMPGINNDQGQLPSFPWPEVDGRQELKLLLMPGQSSKRHRQGSKGAAKPEPLEGAGKKWHEGCF